MVRLTDFDVLSFDCYGTLIDWETGILSALAPWLEREGVRPGRELLLESFGRHESVLEANKPRLPYPEILTQVHRGLAAELGVRSSDEDAAAFAVSVGEWPAFSDSGPALHELARSFELVVLSNVDNRSFRRSEARLGVEFDAVFTAEDIGSYKPDPRNFEYMLRRLEKNGFGPDRVLHVAQSLYHDHVPAQRLGLATAWIDRRHGRKGWGATRPPAETARPDFRFESMAELAAAACGSGA